LTIQSDLTQAQVLITSALSQLPATNNPPPSTVITVKNGDNLQAAIDLAAKSNQDILIDPGSYAGPFFTRARPLGSKIITIRPNVDVSQLQMNRPTSSPVTIVPTGNLGIGTDKGSNGYCFQSIGISSPGINGTMVQIDCGSSTASPGTLDDIPDSISLIACFLDGGNACKRGILGNGGNIILKDSTIKGVMKTGQDTQAFSAAKGPGPFLIQNNFLSASGETIIFGGDDPNIPGMIPSNIIIRGNYVTKDLAWRIIKGSVKNVIEFKNANKFLVENNIFENSWVDEQSGFIFELTVRNQNGTAPWSTISNGEIRYNVLRHGYQGFNVLGQDDISHVSGGPTNTSIPMNNVNIHHNYAYDIGNPAFADVQGTRIGVSINNGPIGLTYDHNVILGPLSEFLALSLGKANRSSQSLKITNSILPEGNYGIAGSSFISAVDAASVFDYNMIIQGTSGRKIVYPGLNNAVIPNMPMTLPFTPPSFKTNDGTPIGVLVSDLQSRIPEFDPTK